jgi:EAL and modified HD-GYP domain-containing signal transduction protein
MKPPAPVAAPESESYLALQPIFDRDLRLYAYELLFRAGHGEDALVNDDHRASATVMHHVFNKLGADAVLGPHLGFINLDAAMLASSVIERLPKEKVVLEILETVEVNADLVARCAALAHQGFRLALDDFSGQETRFEPLLPLVDVIKVDLHRVARGALKRTTARLHRWPARLLAEKIDSEEQVERCRDLGYDLFQGYHLGRPRLISFGPRAVTADAPGRELLDVRRVPRQGQ